MGLFQGKDQAFAERPFTKLPQNARRLFDGDFQNARTEMEA